MKLNIKKGLLVFISILLIILLGVLFNYLTRDTYKESISYFKFPDTFNCINEDTTNKCILKSNNNEAIIYVKKVSLTNNNILVELLINLNNLELDELKVSKYTSELAGAYITDDLFVIGFNESNTDCNINLYVFDNQGNNLKYNSNEYFICKVNANNIELINNNGCNNYISNDTIIKKIIELQYIDNSIKENVIDSYNYLNYCNNRIGE